jgi:hypothetical protein
LNNFVIEAAGFRGVEIGWQHTAREIPGFLAIGVIAALLGYLWITAPGVVFGLAAEMALISLSLALLIPRHPEPGNETILRPWMRRLRAAAQG